MRRPAFWDCDGATARLLAPLAAAWTLAARLRRAGARPLRVAAPVICVGNAATGGAGKTPLALAILDRLAALGRNPHALSRGYAGRLKGPLRVDPDRHTAREVGDEPLLLARHGPVWIGADRRRSAALAIADGADVLVMDDGLQNHGLAKDLSILSVDGEHGFGNGRVMPAGPLREPAADALARCHAVAIVGEDRRGLAGRLAGGGRPILRAALAPAAHAPALRGERVFAFAGVARPARFFAMLEAMGAEVAAARAFGDHRRYAPRAVEAMIAEARRMKARPVTTEKDWVRLDAGLRPQVEPVPVELAFRDAGALDLLLAPLLGERAP